MRGEAAHLTVAEARAALGLDGPAQGAALTAAFRQAVKAARPDLPGGDEWTFRRVIAAHDLLKRLDAPLALPAPEVRRPAPATLAITPLQALSGGTAVIRAGGKRLRATYAPGLRTGDRLRLKGAGREGADLYLAVVVRGCGALSVVGDDLHMTAPVPQQVLRDGGRIEIATHAGPRSAWLVPNHPTMRLRLRDLGLPARGSRRRGHLFVTLEPVEDAPSASVDLRARFARDWTPERRAA
ncbi:MAG TPA: DnaJ C-terminal domain-containing protein [Brevundimonas sp.]|jgi:curved DNA-binding protein|uniref:DnaJ C-terminal domain-containing protein n=1 Tax=Brevundimonas sp. TaxID=1871086 RepID=UPI002DE85F32|nr:DnaJ C-terminal domain-containing protein [Brevundimonas sp.]